MNALEQIESISQEKFENEIVIASISSSIEENNQIVETHQTGQYGVIDRKCRCGCVPDVMSLFEMAALRAKKREEKERELKKNDDAVKNRR